MGYELKEGTGSLFQQSKKTEKQPDYTGNLMINGVKKRIAGWIKESARGVKYISLNISDYKKREECHAKNYLDNICSLGFENPPDCPLCYENLPVFDVDFDGDYCKDCVNAWESELRENNLFLNNNISRLGESVFCEDGLKKNEEEMKKDAKQTDQPLPRTPPKHILRKAKK